ncbi:MAG: DUF2332 domain-containing protein, partial [Nocardioides sp.]
MDQALIFREQAAACAALGSPMYADLLRFLAEDLEAGGPTRTVLRERLDAPAASVMPLRLLGSVHRLVLERRAGDLALYYPSVGRTWQTDGGCAAFAELLAQQPDAVREWLDRAPQTNEVGRAAALMGGLLHLSTRHPVRLFELGSSAGLNLLADRYHYLAEDGTRYGADRSPVVLGPAW